MRYTLFLLAIIFFASCRSAKITDRIPKSDPEYSLIYVIHGDANYLYHDENGKALQSDEQLLAEAQAVAQEAKSGEVFIYHQKPESKILWLFPKKDRNFIFYKNGKKIIEKDYSPQSGNKPFAKEAQLYRKHSQLNSSDSRQRIFLYFGHEIPEKANQPYHSSRPNVPFYTHNFAGGVQSFLPGDSTAFDLTILSTCNNGTPSMIRELSPYSKYVLASPQNLHLSHIDTDRLPELLKDKNMSPKMIASKLAIDTYQRLAGFLQTAITLSVYDTNQVEGYLPEMANTYDRYLESLSAEDMLGDNEDCANLQPFELADIEGGITKWYKPPQFGSKSTKRGAYSGWGCK